MLVLGLLTFGGLSGGQPHLQQRQWQQSQVWTLRPGKRGMRRKAGPGAPTYDHGRRSFALPSDGLYQRPAHVNGFGSTYPALVFCARWPEDMPSLERRCEAIWVKGAVFTEGAPLIHLKRKNVVMF